MEITEEECNYIRLLMLSTDLASDVVKTFVELKILPNYENDIVNLLESHKHDLFHAWGPNVNCCMCSDVARGSIKSKNVSTINEAIFSKLYENHGLKSSSHIKRGANGIIVQHCLCRFSARTDLRVEDLDLNTLAIVLFICVQLDQNNRQSIMSIQNLQQEVINLGVSKSCPEESFKKLWENLNGAITNLTVQNFPGSVRRMTEKQIQLIKIADVDKVNVDDLEEKINIEKEVGQSLKSAKKGDNLQQANVNYFGKDEGIELELDPSTGDSKMEFFTELLKRMRFDITHSKLPKIVNGYMKSLGLQHYRYKIESPETWDNLKMVAILNKIKKLHNFHILKAEVGSLVIKTTANPDIMKDRETFQNAVRAFLEKLVEVCQIDTSIPATIPVEISISGGPFADSDTLSNGDIASGGAVGGVSNGEGEVQFQIRSQECTACQEKQEMIDRLQQELKNKDIRIAELEKRLAELENSNHEDVDDVD